MKRRIAPAIEFENRFRFEGDRPAVDNQADQSTIGHQKFIP